MDNIFEINNNFDFNSLKISDPILINNNHFSKITHGKFNKNLYLKLNKCLSKSGIIKTAHKSFCELNYIINENNNILEFFENLEKFCLEKIIDNKNKWFYNSDNINSDDIEELITPICKPYKYGKNILIKTQILNNKVLIYNEEENKVNLEDFNPNSEFIPLIHVNGIKFSNRCLILDILLKQILILSPNDDFDNKCLLLNKEKIKQESLEEKKIEKENLEEEKIEKENLEEEKIEKENLEEENLEEENLEEENLEEENLEEEKLKEEKIEKENLGEEIIQEDNLQEKHLEENDNLVNIDITDLENSDVEIFNIKSRDTIYLEMYKTAKKKAKEIRKNAIQAFIEAKHIKTQYNLDNLVNSDSSEEEDF